MRTLKDVLSRKEERENLRNFLLCLLVVSTVVFSFFGFYAVKLMMHETPEFQGRFASVEIEENLD